MSDSIEGPVSNDAINRDCGENAISIWRKRLAFRAWHRGTREADLLIGSFADKTLPDLDGSGLEQFEDLLACPDPDLYDWMTGRTAPPQEHDHRVIAAFERVQVCRSSTLTRS